MKKIYIAIICIMLIFFGYLFMAGYIPQGFECIKHGGSWVGVSICFGPGGCNGGYCICPKDTTKYVYMFAEPEGSEFHRCWGDDGHLVCHVRENLPGCDVESDRCSGPIGCLK